MGRDLREGATPWPDADQPVELETALTLTGDPDRCRLRNQRIGITVRASTIVRGSNFNPNS